MLKTKDSVPKAYSLSKSISALAKRLAEILDERVSLGEISSREAGLGSLMLTLAELIGGQKGQNNAINQKLVDDILACLHAFIDSKQAILRVQGFTCVRDASLRAFYLSALYEAIRFGDGEKVTPTGRRSSVKRRTAAYFSPPGLAYLAALRSIEIALRFYDPAKGKPFTVCDPAMGTGLYLVAALDFCCRHFPEQSPRALAEKSFFGVDFDPLTTLVARLSLSLACDLSPGDSEVDWPGLRWGDGLLDALPAADVVLSNPPWDLVKNVGAGKRSNQARTASLRRGFSRQGEGDTSYYKLFLERGFALLGAGGIVSMLLPAAFCTDKGAGKLRRWLLREASVQAIDGFINSDNAFAIHSQFKYVLVTVRNAGQTEFFASRHNLTASHSDLAGGPASIVDMASFSLFAGEADTLIDLTDEADFALHKAVYASLPKLKDWLAEDVSIGFRREFDLTIDRDKIYTRWYADTAGSGDSFLPLLDGACIAQYDYNKTGVLAAVMRLSDYRSRLPAPVVKVGFQSISSPLNTRSMVAAYLPDWPAANSLPTIAFSAAKGRANLAAIEKGLWTAAIFNSFAFDYFLRFRLVGNNLSYHILAELPFPSYASVAEPLREAIVGLSAALTFDDEIFAGDRAMLLAEPRYAGLAAFDPAGADAATRLAWRVRLETLVFRAYRLSLPEIAHIMRDCDRPAAMLAKRRRSGLNDALWPDARGFYRVDKALPCEQRLTRLILLTCEQDPVRADASPPADYYLVKASLPASVRASIALRFATEGP